MKLKNFFLGVAAVGVATGLYFRFRTPPPPKNLGGYLAACSATIAQIDQFNLRMGASPLYHDRARVEAARAQLAAVVARGPAEDTVRLGFAAQSEFMRVRSETEFKASLWKDICEHPEQFAITSQGNQFSFGRPYTVRVLDREVPCVTTELTLSKDEVIQLETEERRTHPPRPGNAPAVPGRSHGG